MIASAIGDHSGATTMHKRRGFLGWLIVLVLVALAFVWQPGSGAAEDGTPVALAEMTTAPYRVAIRDDEDGDRGAFIGGQCVLVFDTFPAAGTPIQTVC